MRFWKAIVLAAALGWSGINPAEAELDFGQQAKSKHFIATGFTDFPPFGEAFYRTDRDGKEVVSHVENKAFKELFNDFIAGQNAIVEYKYNYESYSNTVRQVRAGNIDIIMGMYYGTKLYDGLDYVIPAVANNPIVLITLPEKAKEIKSIDDLKKMKGAVLEKEHLSDYVRNELKSFKMVTVEKPYDMYKMLFTKEVDFIFSSYYTGIIESSKLGLRNKVSFAKQAIWDMPLFIGVSKASPNNKHLIARLTRYVDNEENLKKFQKTLDEEMARYEMEGQNAVPPIFINE